MEVEPQGSRTGIATPIKFKSNRFRCSTLELFLIFVAAVCFLAVIGLTVALVIVQKDSESESQQQEVCTSEACAISAASVLSSIDRTADPCEDFYQYACGTWMKKNVIPEDRSSFNVFGVLRDDVQVTNKNLLEADGAGDIEAIRKVKDMYQSCLNTDLIEERGTNVTLPMLEELGGWPVLGSSPGGNWVEADFSLTQLLATLTSYNNRPVMNMYVSSDVRESTKRIIYLDQPGLGMPGRNYYLEDGFDAMRAAYVELATAAAVGLGANEAIAATDMAAMMDLETEIANITMKPEDRRDNDALYNKMTIDQMAVNFTEPSPIDPVQFTWLGYFTAILDLPGVSLTTDGNENIVVRAIPYYEKLFNVLQRHSKRTIANYIVWTIMKNRISNLPGRFRDLVTKYNEVLYGSATARARWRDCTDYVVGQMGMAVGQMFVRVAFDESAKEIALEMIGNIREAFNELLDDLDWMDDATKVLAREKAAAMNAWIGFPDEILDDDTLNELYVNVTAEREDYFGNILSNLKRSAANGLANLREDYDKNVWSTPPSTVNAFYNSILNNIMFPAGILQPPFYGRYQPKSMNYGGIGVVIGHEITHGFDDRGRQYDKDGNLRDWWEPEVVDKFKEKAQCIVDQYGNFVVPEADINVNGVNTQGENIADNGGLKQSFTAYRKWVQERGREEPLLPGVNFTHNQLFFVNFAQIWCNNLRREAAISAVNTGVHSPGRFRVIGTLQNSKDFAEAFKCSNTAYMNPANKCYVW